MDLKSQAKGKKSPNDGHLPVRHALTGIFHVLAQSKVDTFGAQMAMSISLSGRIAELLAAICGPNAIICSCVLAWILLYDRMQAQSVGVTRRKQQRPGTTKVGKSTTKPKIATTNPILRPPAPLTDHNLTAIARLHCTIKPHLAHRTPTSTATLHASPMHPARTPRLHLGKLIGRVSLSRGSLHVLRQIALLV